MHVNKCWLKQMLSGEDTVCKNGLIIFWMFLFLLVGWYQFMRSALENNQKAKEHFSKRDIKVDNFI